MHFPPATSLEVGLYLKTSVKNLSYDELLSLGTPVQIPEF
jgi:hypothetical protein